MPEEVTSSETNRRSFLATTAAGAAAVAMVPSTLNAGAYAGGSDLLKVGLVGVGGRGTGAAEQALNADPATELVALGDVFEDAVERNPPPAPGGKRIKLRYATQIKTRPPSFVIFGTRVDQLPESYRRYLVNGIRRDLGFGAVPVRLTLRAPKNPFDTSGDR